MTLADRYLMPRDAVAERGSDGPDLGHHGYRASGHRDQAPRPPVPSRRDDGEYNLNFTTPRPISAYEVSRAIAFARASWWTRSQASRPRRSRTTRDGYDLEIIRSQQDSDLPMADVLLPRKSLPSFWAWTRKRISRSRRRPTGNLPSKFSTRSGPRPHPQTTQKRRRAASPTSTTTLTASADPSWTASSRR